MILPPVVKKLRHYCQGTIIDIIPFCLKNSSPVFILSPDAKALGFLDISYTKC